MKLSIVYGNNQTKGRILLPYQQPYSIVDFDPLNHPSMAYFDPVFVLLTDDTGSPLPGKTINFTITSQADEMTAEIGLDNPYNERSVATDVAGMAALDNIRAYYSNGTFTVTASCGDASAIFNFLVGGQNYTLSVLSGDGQSVPRTVSPEDPTPYARFAPITVKVTDENSAPVAGVFVDFWIDYSLSSHGMDGQMSNRGDVTTVFTDSRGMVVMNQMDGYSIRVCFGEGPFTVLARVDDGKPVAMKMKVIPSISNGMRVRADNGAVFIVIDGVLHGISSPTIYNNLFKDWNNMVQVPTVEGYPVSDNLEDNVCLVKANYGEIFLLMNNVKHSIGSMEIFDKFWFNIDKVHQRDDDMLLIGAGSPIIA